MSSIIWNDPWGVKFNTLKLYHMTGIRNDFQKKHDSTLTNSTDEEKRYVNEF